METITLKATPETCEACIDRDLIIAAQEQRIALLQAENRELRDRIAWAVRGLGTELLRR